MGSGIFIKVVSEKITKIMTVDNNLIPEGDDWFEITHDPLGFAAYRQPRDYTFKDGKLYGN